MFGFAFGSGSVFSKVWQLNGFRRKAKGSGGSKSCYACKSKFGLFGDVWKFGVRFLGYEPKHDNDKKYIFFINLNHLFFCMYIY